MLTLKLKEFVPIDGLVHQATTWQIATDKEFKNIVENIKSVKYLNGYQSELIIPEGLVYWARAKRHFNTPNADYYTEPSKIIANSSDITNMVLDNEILVDEPVIYVNHDEVTSNDSDTITIKTSQFRSAVDLHKATTWLVRNIDGDLLFYSLENEKDRTSITIKKTPEMKVESDLVFSAIHIGSSGVESKIGTTIVKSTGYQYRLLTTLSDVQPYVDYTIHFGSKREDGLTKILKISLTDMATNEIVYETNLSRMNTITIPWDRLKFGAKFYLDVHCYDNNGIFGISRHIMSTRASYVTPIESIHKDYKDSLSSLSGGMTLSYNYPIVTMETPMGYIPYPKNNELSLYKYKINNKTGLIEKTQDTLNGVSLVISNPANLNIRYTQDDILIVDTIEKDTDGKEYPVFMIYSYLRNKDTYILVSKIKRKDEVATTGVLNNLVQYSATEFFYIPWGKQEIRRLDLNNNYVTRVIDLPSTAFINANLIWLPANKFLVLGRDAYAKVYDIETKTFLSSIATPVNFRFYDRKQLLLPNGDTIMVKVGDDVDDNKPALLKFSYKDKKFVELGDTFPYKTAPTSMVLLVNDNVLLYDYISADDIDIVKYNSKIDTAGCYGYVFE